MPAGDYAFITEGWRVIVLVRPTPDSQMITQVPGPYMPLEKAEADINTIRATLHGDANVRIGLAWLALTASEVLGAYLAA